MLKNLLASLSILILISSCSNSEVEKLRAENDSLRMQLENQQKIMSVMGDVQVLLDSIDASRHFLRIDLHEGTSYRDVTRRLENLNGYVKNTQTKLEAIEKEIKDTKYENGAYLMMIDALKDELIIHSREITELQAAVNDYQQENRGLIKTVKLQQQQVAELEAKIASRQQELALLESKIQRLVANFQVTEAEATYARAKAVEEAANRTRLAPRKKKETYRESLDLYKKALELGKTGVEADIARVEKKAI